MNVISRPRWRYLQLNGRCGRKEFLRVCLVVLCACATGYAMSLLGAALGSEWLFHAGWLLLALSACAGLVLMLAAAVRRLHDIDESGWFVVLVFVPLGVFCLFPLLLLPGSEDTNRFGKRHGRKIDH